MYDTYTYSYHDRQRKLLSQQLNHPILHALRWIAHISLIYDYKYRENVMWSTFFVIVTKIMLSKMN